MFVSIKELIDVGKTIKSIEDNLESLSKLSRKQAIKEEFSQEQNK